MVLYYSQYVDMEGRAEHNVTRRQNATCTDA